MVDSPCVNICRMDLTSGWCEGCLRTIDEIAGWSTMSDDDKRRVCAHLAPRRLARRRGRLAEPVEGPEPAGPSGATPTTAGGP